MARSRLRGPCVWIVGVVSALSGCGADVGPATAASEPAFLTLAFGRTQWQPYVGCRPLAGGVTLDRVADELRRRGRVATGLVVVDRTLETERSCEATVQYASWADMARLRDDYGWTFVSNGTSHRSLSGLDPAEQEREACGSLEALQARGHDRAWGLFGHAANKVDKGAQASTVARCFAFGRRYGDAANRRRSIGPPWLQTTFSVNGGRCEDRSRSCATIPVRRAYEDPATLARMMQPGPGEWRVVQAYRFVEGRRAEGYNAWDCTGTDWRRHWTSRPELYCLEDFLAAVDRIPASVTVTDPATVAEAWGRLPASAPRP